MTPIPISDAERRVLVLAPIGQDASLIVHALASTGILATVCAALEDLLGEHRSGSGLWLIAEEALSLSGVAAIQQAFERQEAWSDLPMIVLTSSGHLAQVSTLTALTKMTPTGNLTLLERPLRALTLVQSVQASLRARMRQYHVRDLLLEREQEKALLASKVRELAQSNAELEQFAFIAAHDLQEPIRMIVSYLQLMERELKPHFTPKARDFFDFVRSSAIRMKSMVLAVLDYSRIGKDDQGFVEVDCTDAVHQALESLDARITAANAVITIEPLPRVRGSSLQIIRLFQNLISNSIKFRSSQPLAIHISSRRTGTDWVISVADNGIGIDPDEGGKLFRIFQRLNSSEQYPGTGIGLAACRKIIEQHGGRIWFDSTPGVGSTFHFSLPDSSHG